jgi:hypothetical protein
VRAHAAAAQARRERLHVGLRLRAADEGERRSVEHDRLDRRSAPLEIERASTTPGQRWRARSSSMKRILRLEAGAGPSRRRRPVA